MQQLQHSLTFFLLLVLCSFSLGQTVLLQESFETDGETTRYVSNSGNDPVLSDIWDRTDQNPAPYHSLIINTGTRDGSWYWVGEDVFSLTGGVDGIITLNALSVSGNSNLDVQIALGMSRFGQNRWENDDFVAIEYNIDGTGWNTIGLFTGDNPTPALGGALKLDTDNNIATFGPFGSEITDTFVDFTFSIPVTGNSLQVRVRTNCNGSEEIAFDNIRIRGIVSTNNAPVLANIEGTPISYAEGDPAVQVTSALTVSDTDDVNLDSAKISITAGLDGTEDVLAATPVGGILASYNATVGVLSLTGSASLADYQTTLQSVTYQNTDVMDATPNTRTISFQVNDGTDGSNFQTRDIDVSASLNTTPASLPFCESFESDGEGTRYGSDNFDNTPGACNFAERGPAGTSPGNCFAEVITGADGAFVFNTEDTDANGGFTLTSQPLDISSLGLADLTIEVLVGVSRDDEARWENDDQFRVEYSIDGSPYAIVGLFTGNNPGVGIGGDLFEDTDQDPTTFGPFGATAVPDVFTNYSFTFQGSGSEMTYRIVVNSNGSEELAFDNICVSGVTLCTNDTTNISATTCDPAQAGMTQQTLMNAGGCDSLVITTTSLLPSDTTDIAATTCDSTQVGITSTLLTNQFGCDSLVVTTTTLDPPTDAGADAMLNLTEGDSVDLDTIVTVSGGSFSINDTLVSNLFFSAGLGDTTITVIYIVPSTTSCPDDTATITISVKADPMSIESLILNGQQIDFTLYPNPSTDYLVLQSSEILLRPVDYEVRNILGQQLFQSQVMAGSERESIHIQELPAGIYLLRVLNPKGKDAVLRFEKTN